MNSKKDDLSMSGFHTIQMAFYIWGYIMTTDLETLCSPNQPSATR